MKKISIVIPSFNESANIPVIAAAVKDMLKGRELQVIFVDDGSTDDSLSVLRKLSAADSSVEFIALSRNFGHQHALKAGMDKASGDCVIMMDGDLQHPPELLPAIIEKWEKENYQVVFTKRADDPNLSLFKRATSSLFYGFMNLLSDVRVEQGSADFRLLDRSVVNVITSLNDPFLFLRGLVPWLGFSQYCIEYKPGERHSGESKYSILRMMNFAVNGITSFSVKPLHFATLLGLLISLFAFAYGIYAVVFYLVSDRAISGWASVLTSILFIGGIQLIMLGIIGEYIGKIYMHLKNRPQYIIKESSLK